MSKDLHNILDDFRKYGFEVRIKHDTGIAWAGFWIGLGIVIAAAVLKGQVVIK